MGVSVSRYPRRSRPSRIARASRERARAISASAGICGCVLTQLSRKNPCARRAENESEGRVKIAALCCLPLLACCNHAPAVPARAGPSQKAASVALPIDPSKAAAELSAEAHDLLRVEGELLRSEERRVGKECRSRWS